MGFQEDTVRQISILRAEIDKIKTRETPNISALRFEELSTDPPTPDTGQWKIYFKAGGLYHIDDAGTVTGPIT